MQAAQRILWGKRGLAVVVMTTAKCREVIVDSDSRDRQMRARYELCKKGKDWGFRAPSRPAK